MTTCKVEAGLAPHVTYRPAVIVRHTQSASESATVSAPHHRFAARLNVSSRLVQEIDTFGVHCRTATLAAGPGGCLVIVLIGTRNEVHLLAFDAASPAGKALVNQTCVIGSIKLALVSEGDMHGMLYVQPPDGLAESSRYASETSAAVLTAFSTVWADAATAVFSASGWAVDVAPGNVVVHTVTERNSVDIGSATATQPLH